MRDDDDDDWDEEDAPDAAEDTPATDARDAWDMDGLIDEEDADDERIDVASYADNWLVGEEDDDMLCTEPAEDDDASARCWTRNSMCGMSSASHSDWMCEPRSGSCGPIIATTPDDIW